MAHCKQEYYNIKVKWDVFGLILQLDANTFNDYL